MKTITVITDIKSLAMQEIESESYININKEDWEMLKASGALDSAIVSDRFTDAKEMTSDITRALESSSKPIKAAFLQIHSKTLRMGELSALQESLSGFRKKFKLLLGYTYGDLPEGEHDYILFIFT